MDILLFSQIERSACWKKFSVLHIFDLLKVFQPFIQDHNLQYLSSTELDADEIWWQWRPFEYSELSQLKKAV